MDSPTGTTPARTRAIGNYTVACRAANRKRGILAEIVVKSIWLNAKNIVSEREHTRIAIDILDNRVIIVVVDETLSGKGCGFFVFKSHTLKVFDG